MKFLRNPEIKKNLIIYTIISILGILLIIIDFINPLYILIAFIISFITISLIFDFIRYKRIERLSVKINKILHHEDYVIIDKLMEGELSILESEINKMTIRLREQSNHLLNDKKFLNEAITDISHQIKTPLTSINLLLDLLIKPSTSIEKRNLLGKELESLLIKMEWLINTLLKMSKLDSKTAYFKKDKVYVRELILHAIQPIEIMMELRGILVKLEIEENLCFIGDFIWTSEAINNIIKNCIEHLSKKEIKEGQIYIKGLSNPIYTEILIIDNGQGIDKEDLPYIFDRFYKGKNSTTESTGIGLALARRIIIQQRGTIKVENNLANKKGVKFTIRFYK